MKNHLRRLLYGVIILVVLGILGLLCWQGLLLLEQAWGRFGWWLLAIPVGITICYFVGFAADRVEKWADAKWADAKWPPEPKSSQSHSYPGY